MAKGKAAQKRTRKDVEEEELKNDDNNTTTNNSSTTTTTTTTTTTSEASESSKSEASSSTNSTNNSNNDDNGDNNKEIPKEFEGKDFYEILGVQRDASPKEITLAYRNKAKEVHPDRNLGDPSATSKFQYLGKVYGTLNDPEKRKIYDQTGDSSDEGLPLRGDINWDLYWRALFQRVDVQDVESFEGKYKYSEEEKNDIIKLYQKFGGELSSIMDSLMFANWENVDRYLLIINEAIAKGTLKKTEKFTATSTPKYIEGQKKKAKKETETFERQRKAEKEKENQSKKKKLNEPELPLALTSVIKSKKQQDELADKLMEKYAPKKHKGSKANKNVIEEPSEQEFQTARERLTSGKKKSK